MPVVVNTGLLNEIQYHLVEPPDFGTTWPSGLWTTTEVSNYITQRARQFVKDTGITMKRTTISTIPGVTRHPLPTDWVATRRLVWKNNLTSVFSSVERSDEWDLDHGRVDWMYNTEPKPIVYTEVEIPSLQIQTAPSVNVAGVLEILYVPVVTAFDTAIGAQGGFFIDSLPIFQGSLQPYTASDLSVMATFGFGINGAASSSTIPSEYWPAIKWGTIADMLSKIGRAYDPGRAAYAESRYQEGVAASRLGILAA